MISVGRITVVCFLLPPLILLLLLMFKSISEESESMLMTNSGTYSD